ncbi:hypothetical protein CONCODRAFT_85154 [Conidiobolus coronatus NRRL 28638]|uniref:RNI-like protein n=1 Tax=Conidiobolus coronatus (strain ATCC 28846 / CBS 209.66 / NRRL 28638) TaxID=796925 RepID=A0A137P6N4_CONC2|nr:hypothetical protein CONCODRAFT_85154 [Conidiobolus coronatus NRRL 28638]|eukprot:KXN70673.1 hypothetical protein CONCODRAFT_85154 [Conidiobolus coronatus NRRL 28638]
MDSKISKINELSNWIEFIHWKELIAFLNKTELIKLSCVNGHFRKKLRPFIFNIISYEGHPLLSKYFKNNSFGIGSKNDNMYNGELYWDIFDSNFGINSGPTNYVLNRDIAKIKETFKEVSHMVKFLSIKEPSISIPYQYQYNTPTIQYFSKLEHLELEFVVTPMTVLNQMFEKLDQLKSLSLKEIGVITEKKHRHYILNLKLPRSIASLAIEKGIELKQEMPENQNDVFSAIFYDTNRYFHLQPQHLPNLKHFSYKNDIMSFSNTICEFIKLNPQISELEASTLAFDDILMRELSLSKSIRKLTLTDENWRNVKTGPKPFPKLDSVNFLKLNLHQVKNIPLHEKILQSCSNIKHLYLKNNHVCRDFIRPYLPCLSHLPQLSNLSVSTHKVIPLNYTLPQCTSLRSLRIFDCDTITLDVKLYLNDSQLNLLYINLEDAKQGELESIIAQCEQFTNWNYNQFPKSIHLYRN